MNPIINWPWHRIAQAVTIAIAAVLFFNCILFTYYNANPLVKSDGWRFIQIYLVPWYNGELHWADLWHDHHPQPLTAVLFIVNASLFNLRMDYEALFAASFSLLSILTIWRAYNKSVLTSNFNKYSFILVSLALLCSLNSTAIYSWSLVTVGHIYIFFAFLALYFTDNSCKSDFNAYGILAYAIYLALFFIVFSDGAKIIMYSCVSILFLSLIIDRRKVWLIPISSVMLAIIIQKIFLHYINYETTYNEIKVFSSIFEKLPYLTNYFLYTSVGLMSGWLNTSFLVEIVNLSKTTIYVFGSFIFIFYIFTLYMFFKHKIYLRTIIPGALILSSVLTGAAASVFRFNPEIQEAITANVPRYYLLYMLGAIGVVWVWSIISGKANNKRAVDIMATSIVVAILISQSVLSLTAWESTQYRKKAYHRSYEIMLKNGSGDTTAAPPRFMTGRNYPQPYLNGLHTLKEKRLNMFNDSNMMERFAK